jgi:ketosteroid isomerase-like protein
MDITDGPHRNLRLRLVLILVGLAVLLGVAVLLRQRAVSDDPSAAQRAIQDVLDAQVAAWNKGDLEAFMTGYWQSPELSFFSGKDKTPGWEATLKRYQTRYQAEGSEMGTLTFRELEIERLGPDSAFVRGRWQLQTSKDNPGGLFTLIFKRLPQGWRIVHDHTSS